MIASPTASRSAITCEQQGAFAPMKGQSDWPQLYRAMYARVLRQSLPKPAFLLWSEAMRPAVTDNPVDFDRWVGRRDDKPADPHVNEARSFLDERYWALRTAREEAAAKAVDENKPRVTIERLPTVTIEHLPPEAGETLPPETRTTRKRGGGGGKHPGATRT